MKVELMKVRRIFTDEEGTKWAEVEVENDQPETITDINAADIELRPVVPAFPAAEGGGTGDVAENGKQAHWTQRPENKKKLAKVIRASALARSRKK